ncbi:heterokaryon incompatibility protein-domain-containing protein [Hyaloscypha sp. PMI_1271]|nr:heterokaryon incompatibility protein-domain-containing protein [Hyaloscypha sp. PMI_1271]
MAQAELVGAELPFHAQLTYGALTSSATSSSQPGSISMEASYSTNNALATTDSTPQAVFQYQPLDPSIREIRLLNLTPTDDPHSDLELSILHTPLETLSFYALSYTWGSPQNPREILLNGIKLQVRVNLFAALKAISLQLDAPVMIWADAICINQNDSEEKGQQVKMMTDIYRTAKQTLIWLGEGDAETDALINAMDVIGSAAFTTGIMKLGEDDAKKWPNLDPEKADLRKAVQKLIRSTANFPILPLTDLSYREWFSRVWIIQELSVAKTVTFVCGSKWIDGNNFIAAFKFGYYWFANEFEPLKNTSGWLIFRIFKMALRNQQNKLSIPNPRAATTLGTRKMITPLEFDTNATSSSGLTLMQHMVRGFTLSVGEPLDSSEPKDRIYAFLGISNDRKELGIVENYKEEVTYQHIYAETAKALIRQGNLDILSLCRSPTSEQIERDSRLPSWAPDWTKRMITPCGGFKADGLFKASDGMKDRGPRLEPATTEWNVLAIDGMFVGTASKLGTPWRPSWNDSFDYQAAHVLFQEVEGFVKESGSQCTDTQKQEAIWRIPIGNKEMDSFGQPRRLGPGRGTAYKEYVQMRNLAAKQHKLGEESLMVTQNLPSCLGMLKDMYDARPMLTDNGYVGVCLDCAEEGDEVWILRGAHVPYVLRKSEAGTSRLVGEAFVYGMMDGEVCSTGAALHSLQLI